MGSGDGNGRPENPVRLPTPASSHIDSMPRRMVRFKCLCTNLDNDLKSGNHATISAYLEELLLAYLFIIYKVVLYHQQSGFCRNNALSGRPRRLWTM